MMKHSFLRALAGTITILLFPLLNACGSAYEEVEIKQYYLYVQSDDANVLSGFQGLMDEFNADAGLEVLNLARNADEANSEILMTEGLNARDGKVGWGQWIRNTEVEGGAFLSGETPRKIHRFSMRLEFDYDYVMQRMFSKEETKQYDLKKLFSHEVGHGLQMGHHENPASVMYKDISGDKDFRAFFTDVRNYF